MQIRKWDVQHLSNFPKTSTTKDEDQRRLIYIRFNEILYKAWFSYVEKIPGDRGFNFLPTVPDFAHVSDNRQKSVPEKRYLCVIEGLEPSNLEDW